ncbi:sperm-associated antigen 17 isoform X2 [Limanda limanda]|uniref:sperm-associated antigen 17 isoform X2 n=1 Tax=Limanda limanda TaxID=27771 RepID=UPI0029C80595|nr:sperm-associated antigen 17 isoform X2 [Limanda limanda]
MPPKPSKKGSAKKPNGEAPDNPNWEAGLTEAQFEEDSWRACVSFVVGGSLEVDELIQALAVQPSQRKLFTLLTLDSTIAMIQVLGNPKSKKSNDTPVFYEVTESAKQLLDAGEEIPCDLMAKILKFQLLQVKAKDQERRAAEQELEEMAKAGSTPVKKGADKKGKGPPPVEKKTNLKRRGDVEPIAFMDDEPDDGPQHYILLLGFHQPHLILILDAIGVHVANVIKVCSQKEQQTSQGNKQRQCASPVLDADSGRMEQAARARRLDLFWAGLRPVLDSVPPNSKLHSLAQLSSTLSDLLTSIQPQNTESMLKLGSQVFDSVAYLLYDCLDWRRQHQNYLDSSIFINLPTVVGSDFQRKEGARPTTPQSKKKTGQEADMNYYSDLLNLVPPEACSVPLIMHCMLEQVVMSSEQSDLAQSRMAKKPKPADASWLDYELVHSMLQSCLPLIRTEEEQGLVLEGLVTVVQSEGDKKRLEKMFGAEEAEKKSDDPLVIRHHDERALRLRDIRASKSFDPAAVELSMIKSGPVWELIHSEADPRKSSSCWMAIKQQLQHYCTDDVVSWPQVERLLHQSVFETMPLTGLDQNSVIQKAAGTLGALEPAQQQEPPTIIPWDNPQSYSKQLLCKPKTKGPTFLTAEPGNTELIERVCQPLELSDIQSCRLRSLFDWHYTEHHDPSIFPQVLQVASEEHCCLDTFRGSHNNIRYIFCHNPQSLHYQCKEYWDAVLHTDVKFRTYLEHVADIISDWTREEELKIEAIQRSLDESTEDETAKDSAEKEEDTLGTVIRKESLKALKAEQDRLMEEEMAKKLKKESTPKGKKGKEEAKPTDNKNDVPVPTPVESSTVPPGEENEELQQTEEPFHGFTGYSMDGMLIHVSGRLQHLFPSDGGHITVEDIIYVEGSCLIKLAVKKDGHHFYTYINQVVIPPARPSSQPPKKETSDKKYDCKEPGEEKRVKQGSLTAVLNNGVHLSYSFYGPTGEFRANTQETDGGITDTTTQVPAPPTSSSQDPKSTDLDSDAVNKQIPSSQNSPQVSQNLCEDQPAPFNGVNLSVPTGLMLQFLREDIPGESSEVQVRQSFPLHGREEVWQPLDPSLAKELSRIVTSQGAVIRYMRDGSTEVLFADGSVSFSQDGGPVWVPDSEVKEETTPKVNMKEQSKEKAADAQRGCWLTTTPSGARICTVGTTHKHLPTIPVLAFKATDSLTHEVMLSREDLVVSVHNSDGSTVVDHADGTRITSLHQERPSNTEEQHKSVTLNATSECVCGCTECVCVACCADNINENISQDARNTGDEKSRDNAGKACGKEDDRTEMMACEDVCDERECDENALCKNCVESVFAKENGETSAREKGSVSTKERVMLVEKEGYATVVMYPERHTAHVFLADGTVITGNIQGAYQVFPPTGLLQIQSDGKCVYSSDPLVNPSPMGDTPTNQPGSYTMSHTDKVACDITDADGNHFQVTEDGQVSVLNVNPTLSTLKHDEEEEEEDREVSRLHDKYGKHCPRLFLVHEDGSGTELLRSQTVEELLYQADSDPAVAVWKEPLPDTQDEFGITILKPRHQSVGSQWMLGKQNPDITPPNIRNRNWRDFPRKEEKSPGPAFGTNMGRGLTLRDWPASSTAQHQHAWSFPKVLEMRELCQHQPCSRLFKNTIDARLKKYIESLMEREQRSEAMKVKDPRTDKESVHASDLLNLVQSFREEEDTNPTSVKRTPADIGSLYNQGIRAEDQQPDISKSTSSAESDSSVNEKKSKWTGKHAQYRQEVCEEKACRVALRRKSIVPYFHPENIQLYQLQNQAPNMKRLSMDLPLIPKSHCAQAFLKNAPQENTPRPLNPTPTQSSSRAAGSDGLPLRRPTNPTPQTAGESRQKGSPRHFKSVQVDVIGEPRRSKVQLPTSILASKPRSMPNQQFLSLDEPLRRRCRTVSLINPDVVVRGFVFLPPSVDFGTVREGTSSFITVVMRNVGVDTCRFHLKQPRASTGLRVIYNPGPVAAGLQVELQVQLFAKCTSQAGDVETKKDISQDIIIHTETDIFFLPVAAIILPVRSYDILLKDRTSASKRKSSRVLRLSSSLPDGQGVTPRRPDTLLTSSAAKPGNLNRSTSR